MPAACSPPPTHSHSWTPRTPPTSFVVGRVARESAAVAASAVAPRTARTVKTPRARTAVAPRSLQPRPRAHLPPSRLRCQCCRRLPRRSSRHRPFQVRRRPACRRTTNPRTVRMAARAVASAAESAAESVAGVAASKCSIGSTCRTKCADRLTAVSAPQPRPCCRYYVHAGGAASPLSLSASACDADRVVPLM